MLKRLASLAFNVATLPVQVVKDIATTGGVSTDHGEPYTWSTLKRIGRQADALAKRGRSND